MKKQLLSLLLLGSAAACSFSAFGMTKTPVQSKEAVTTSKPALTPEIEADLAELQRRAQLDHQLFKNGLESPLILAIKKDKPATALYLIGKQPDLITQASLYGDPDMPVGSLPLQVAIEKGQVPVVKAILHTNPSAATLPSTGRAVTYPLHSAAHAGTVEIAQLLLDNKADISKKSAKGFTALDRGYKHPQMVKFLLSKGAHVSPDCLTTPSPEALDLFLQKDKSAIDGIYPGSYSKLTYLGRAIQAKDPAIAALFIDHGAKLVTAEGKHLMFYALSEYDELQRRLEAAEQEGENPSDDDHARQYNDTPEDTQNKLANLKKILDHMLFADQMAGIDLSTMVRQQQGANYTKAHKRLLEDIRKKRLIPLKETLAESLVDTPVISALQGLVIDYLDPKPKL